MYALASALVLCTRISRRSSHRWHHCSGSCRYSACSVPADTMQSLQVMHSLEITTHRNDRLLRGSGVQSFIDELCRVVASDCIPWHSCRAKNMLWHETLCLNLPDITDSCRTDLADTFSTVSCTSIATSPLILQQQMPGFKHRSHLCAATHTKLTCSSDYLIKGFSHGLSEGTHQTRKIGMS